MGGIQSRRKREWVSNGEKGVKALRALGERGEAKWLLGWEEGRE